MTPAQYQRVSEIFLGAIRLDGAGRDDYLRSACGSDLAVRDKVLAMLAEHDSPKVDLESPVMEASLQIDDLFAHLSTGESEPVPERLGSYQILEVLGKGGMGVVYRAQQKNPKRTVALKAIRHGLSSSKAIQRFALEAEALARLQHPGIAQIFEAGADVGASDRDVKQPFFAMELVEGEPLTHYAETHQLNLRQKVALLAQVCEAVHHAHTKGVIHRDLKPSNILVDATGRSKVLDFGVARVLDDNAATLTAETNPSQLIGTLRYMSPEQVAGDTGHVDTRCDVYALGVIGYELIGGQPPYDLVDMNIPQASRVISDANPQRLSQVERRAAGDLEAIIHKALEKEADRRYPTAGELAADLKRFLANEPVVARPPTLAYQISKFSKRHRLAVMAMLAACLAVVIGIAGLIRGGIIAANERSEAQRQYRIAQAINGFLNDDLLALADPLAEPNGDLTVKEALDRASRSVASRFAKRDEVRAAIEATLGRTYMALGEYAKAEHHLTEAESILHSIYETDDPHALAANGPMIELLRRTGRLDEARTLGEATLDALKESVGLEHVDTLSAMDALGMVLLEQGDFEAAEHLFSQALTTLEQVEPDGELAMRVRGSLSDAYKWQGRIDEATPLNESLAADARERWGENDARTAIALNKLATLYLRKYRFEDARSLFEDAVEIAAPILGDSHPEVLTIKSNLGTTLMNLRRYEEAADLLADTYEQTKQSLGDKNLDVIINGQTLGTAYRYLHRFDDARQVFEETVAAADATLGKEHPQSLYARSYLGLTLIDLREFEAAEPLLQESLQLYRETAGDNHPNTLHAENDLAKLFVEMERFEEAEEIYLRIIAAASDETASANTIRAIFQTAYGRCLTAMERFDDAEAQLIAADNFLSTSRWAEETYGRDAIEALVNLYAQTNQTELLEKHRERLAAIASEE
ncbi:MAG TPA: serine/threonine-protein kinase [Phycisphaerae bacterium]|nr:serine/threonine-protein kinase [Phycisphaerae bacterium]